MKYLTAYVTADHWRIGTTSLTVKQLLGEEECRIQLLDDSIVGKNIFLADPFGFMYNDQIYVLAERYHYSTGIADIVCCRVTPENKLADMSVVLALETHLSFPYVFYDKQDIYFCPESSAARSLGIYKMDGSPHHWRLHHTISNSVAAIDPVIFQKDGLWWCLYSTKDHGSQSSLHAKYAIELDGNWIRHKKDPLLVRQDKARNGGSPFQFEGVFYRVVQDSSTTYGGSLNLYRIDTLTPDEYSEIFVCPVKADMNAPYDKGFHTLSRTFESNTHFVDVKTRKISYRAAAKSLYRLKQKVVFPPNV